MDDPRTNVAAFATVLSRAADPYERLDDVLGAFGLDRAAWADVERAWAARMARDPGLASEVAHAFAAMRRGVTRQEDCLGETLLVRPDAASRAALLAPVLPFAAGTFIPIAAAERDMGAGDTEHREGAARAPDIEGTALPGELVATDVLPFMPRGGHR